jgi:Universal stress protein UspA and related nucleotide-binding proteins
MKKIIVATDYSPEANNAAHYAAAIAAEQGHQLILFNVTSISIHALNARVSGDAIDQMLFIHRENLEKEAATLAATYKVKVVTHFATGYFYEELVRCIDQHQADVVVMGMASKTFEQDLLGNTTTAAIHKLQFPILAIPLQARYKGIKKVLFACDIEKGVQEQVLEKIRSLALAFGATIEIFHVETELEELAAESQAGNAALDQALAGVAYTYKNVQSPQIIKAIQKEIQAMQADLLIMVPYKYGFWSSIVHRSKTRMMASGNDIPLLSLPM